MANYSKGNMKRKKKGRRTPRTSGPAREDQNQRSKVEDSQDGVSDRRTSSLNDLSWYAHNPQLLLAASSVPFPYRPGMTLNLGLAQNKASGNVGYNDLYMPIPGIMSINWMPSIGISEDAGSPISLAAREIYAKVRDSYSGTLHADAPDFIIYLVALDSVFSAIGAMKRIFRTVNTFSPENYIVPEGILKILDADPNSWKANRMDAYQYINELALRASKFVCPRFMDYFNRHYWMNDNVYTDAGAANSQFYVFKQVRYWEYSNTVMTPENVPAGGLTSTTIDFSSPASAYSGISRLLTSLAQSEDAYTISGYLMRAFQDQGTFVVEQIGLNELLTPVYVEEVLSQIENSSSVPAGFVPTYTDISQDPKTNAIIYTPQVQVAGNVNVLPNMIHPLLSLRGGTGPAEVTIATRLKTTLDYQAMVPLNEDDVLNIVAGSEIVLEYMIGFYERKGLSGPYLWDSISFNSFMSYTNVGASDGAATTTWFMATCAAKLSQFDWSPFVIGYDFNNLPVNAQVFGDVHNVTTVTPEMLSNINRVCLYSEFNAFGIY